MDPWHLLSDLDNLRSVYELQTISLPNGVSPYLVHNQNEQARTIINFSPQAQGLPDYLIIHIYFSTIHVHEQKLEYDLNMT